MKNQLKFRIFSVISILSLLMSAVGMPMMVAQAAGTTYYVDKTNPSCSDVSTDTSVNPFCTIGRGASVAMAGDTVRVIAGSYAETVVPSHSGAAGNPITFQANPGVSVTGNGTGTGSAFRFFGLSYIVIDGFSVNSTSENGIYVSGSNLTITNNHVTGATANGIFAISSNTITISNNQVNTSGASGIFIRTVSASTISGNTSDHNTLDGIRLSGCTDVTVRDNIAFANNAVTSSNGNGIAVLNNSSANTILHNIVYANRDSGLQFDSGSHDNLVIGNLSYNNGDHGIDNYVAPNQTIIGNTFQGNFTSGINLELNSTGSTVVNNIVADNGLNPSGGRKPYNIYVDSTSVSGTTLDYNLYYLTSPYTRQVNWNGVGYNSLAAFQAAIPGQEIHGVQADPLFVAPAAPATDPPSVVIGDYHLLAGSPAIDSANADAPNEPLTDIDGNARVDDPGTVDTGVGVRTYDDRGAYEFLPSMPSLPIVTTQAVTAISTTTATGNGTITAPGLPNPTQHGVVWSTSANPTTADSKTTDGPVSGAGAFTSAITGLTPGTLYHVRAYATNDVDTSYGGDVSFTTLVAPVAPTVTTQAVTNIATTTATGNGNITSLGSPAPSQHGVVWSVSANPTIADNKTTDGPVSVTGAFTSSITGLTPGILYHVRTYATNTAATVYGEDVVFTTLLAPTVTTQAVTNITITTATGNGNITNLGVPNPTQYGVVWDTAINPTIALVTKTMQGVPAGTGAFTSNITGLTPGTLYHVRAYATNAVGTSYGGDVTFTALIAPTVTTQAVTNITQTSAAGNGNITSLGIPNPTQYGVVWDKAINPTVALATKTQQGVPAGTGAFTSAITGLTPGTLYHVRAYATNAAGTSYGGDVSFTTLPATSNTGFYFANATVAFSGVKDPNRGWTSDNQYAIFDKSTDTAQYGFPDLGIPSGATISGIEVTIEGWLNKTKDTRNLAAALWNTSALNPDSYTASKTAILADTDTTLTLGGPTDKWGTTWMPADFADATFKINVEATSGNGQARLDAIAIKVYYTCCFPTTP